MKNTAKIYLKIKTPKTSNFNKFCFFSFKTCFFNNEFVDLLFEDDLGRSLGEQPVAELHADNSAHGLTDRVEGVHLVQGFLWHLVPDRLVLLTHVKDKAQQSTLRFVS